MLNFKEIDICKSDFIFDVKLFKFSDELFMEEGSSKLKRKQEEPEKY